MAKRKKAEQEKPWNICDDFLDPLVAYLAGFDYDVDEEPHRWLYEKKGDKRYFVMMLYAYLADGDFATVWLQVGTSVALADRVQEALGSLIQAVEQDQAVKAGGRLSE